MAKRKTNGYHAPIYKSYVFRDKDPCIDELRTAIEDEMGEKLSSKMLRKLENQGGPTGSAMHGWFWGATKRPQNCTVEAAGRAAGLQRVWRKIK